MAGAVKLKKIVQNTLNVVAIEALAAVQAMDFLAPLKPSRRGMVAYEAIRAVAPMLREDRSLSKDFERVAAVIASGSVAAALD